eukprot:7446519-Pyramimonas_sp.AAC.1
MDQAVDDAATMMISSATDYWYRSDRPVDRYEMTRMLLAGVYQEVKEAVDKWDPDPITNLLHPHLEDARGWLTGSPNVSWAAAPRDDSVSYTHLTLPTILLV